MQRLRKIRGADIKLVTVKNVFFGPLVTVAGLLTGSDLLKALQNRRLGDRLVIPATMLKEEEDVFLDDMTLSQLEERLNIAITPVTGFRDLMNAVRGNGRAGR